MRLGRALCAVVALAIVTFGVVAPGAGAQQPPTTVPAVGPTTTLFARPPPDVQDTPDLTGVLVVWVLGIAGTVAVLGGTWWRRSHPPGDQPSSR